MSNTGESNTGNRNTGHWNTGHKNTGNSNTGDWNTGHWNTGNCNTGNWNTGNSNTGNWNTGDWNTGYFNTVTPEEILVFNKPTKSEEWGDWDIPDFLFFNLTEGLDYKEAFQKSYNEASEEDRKKVFNLPNFDADVFFEISGIDVRVDVEKETKKQALIRKAEELLKKAEEL